MISAKEFQALAQEQKISILENILRESQASSPLLAKLYAYVTSELSKDDDVLNKMYL